MAAFPLLALFAALSTSLVLSSPVTSDPLSVANKTFDYIIIGGGLAGLTVGRRLSENKSISVLVIEAGKDDRKDPRIYSIYKYGQAWHTSLDWSYPTDQGKTMRAGRTLGGSSSINGAAWTRGTKEQYDSWSQLLDPVDQNLGWDWNGMFAAMKKAESFNTPSTSQQAKGANSIAAYHGFSGPVKVTYPKKMYGGPQQKAFANTMSGPSFGLKLYKDLNGGTPNCVSFTPNSLNANDSDHRSSSATAYLSPVENSTPNWTTLVGQQGVKILFNSGTAPRVASGVRFGVKGSQQYVAFARKEVIVAAGSIGSPAILQLSGIGDKTKLAKFGISSVVDLKTVGLNLQEQTIVSMGANGNGFDFGGSGPSDVIAYPNIYQLYGSGATNAVNHIKNSLSSWASSQSSSAYSASALQTIYNIQASLIIDKNAPIAEIFFDNGYPADLGSDFWQLLPFARGNVTITSADAFVLPKANVNYFGVDFDLQTQIAAARFVRRAFQTSPLKSLSTGESVPGFSKVPDNSAHGSNSSWTTWIKGNYSPVSHPIATCAMMSRSLGGVVDGHLKVYDTANVRVVDASIMPMQVSAHLSSTIYGIAERAAEFIQAAQ